MYGALLLPAAKPQPQTSHFKSKVVLWREAQALAEPL